MCVVLGRNGCTDSSVVFARGLDIMKLVMECILPRSISLPTVWGNLDCKNEIAYPEECNALDLYRWPHTCKMAFPSHLRGTAYTHEVRITMQSNHRRNVPLPKLPAMRWDNLAHHDSRFTIHENERVRVGWICENFTLHFWRYLFLALFPIGSEYVI